MTEHYRLLWCIVIEILLKCKALDLDIIICPMPGIKINVGQPAYYSFLKLIKNIIIITVEYHTRYVLTHSSR